VNRRAINRVRRTGRRTDEAEEESRPLVDVRALLRRTALAVTGIRDLNITYTGTLRSTGTNVGQAFYDEFDQVLRTSE
jgi:hypothetical protein